MPLVAIALSDIDVKNVCKQPTNTVYLISRYLTGITTQLQHFQFHIVKGREA